MEVPTPPPGALDFKARLARVHPPITLKQVAERADYNPAYVSNLLGGRHAVRNTQPTIDRLNEALDMLVEDRLASSEAFDINLD